MNTHSHSAAKAALFTLVIVQAVMLASLFAGVPPHPPASTPLFGIAPLIAMSLSAAVSAAVLNAMETRTGRALCFVAVLAALVSFGPQKYFDPQFPLIWPAVVTGQIAIGVLVVLLLSALLRAGDKPASSAS